MNGSFLAVLDAMPDAVLVVARDGVILAANAQCEAVLGYRPDELVDTSVDLLVPEKLRATHAGHRAHFTAEPHICLMSENRVLNALHHNGYDIPVEIRLSPLLDAAGTHEMVIAVIRDISERKRAEDRLYDLFDNANDLISTCDLDWRLTSANRAFARLSGHARHELIGMKFDQLYTADSMSRAREMRRRKLDGEARATTYEMEMLAKDGGRVPVEVSTRLIVEGGKPVGTHSIGRDLSERKRLEGELRQVQKMEAIGRLAGGIAHDFNNLLLVIIGYAEILQGRIGHDAESGPQIAEVAKAAERAGVLTRQLLAFSRKQALAPRVVSLNDVTADVQTMLGRVVGEHIETIISFADDLASVRVDVGQFEQVLMNLAVNARDAMPDGGTLRFETQNVFLDESYTSRNPGAVPGDYVMVAVSDTGQGMDAATTSQIFEPFFTTKEPGSGTGLGLSTVYGIVKQSSGYVEVESEPVGTTFRIYLPQVSEEAEALEPQKLVEVPLTGTETILFVEDNEAVHRLGRDILERRGYTVLSAHNGEEALELAQSYPDPIHLLMTDLVMPKLGGIELAERLKALSPQLKILYTSGYNDDPGANLHSDRAGTSFLQKPYSVAALTRTLRELLDPSPADKT